MNDELFKQFLKELLKELDEAPDYVKENTMCYFWHNTSACTKCPKKDCKAREPRKIEPNKPHKLIDNFNKMKSCPYHKDWHYCCRCDFEYICKWSDNKIKEVQKKYIKENWGK